MFEDYGELRPFAEAAELLAAHEWPVLYDPARWPPATCPPRPSSTTRTCTSSGSSERTAAAIRGLRPWVTSEYDHDGIRADGGRVLGRLLDLARGRA